VVVGRRRRIQDRQRLQTSTLTTHSNDHPVVPTPQPVRWQLQLPARQLGLQHPRTVRGWTPGQHPTTLDCCTTQRKQPVSSLSDQVKRCNFPKADWKRFCLSLLNPSRDCHLRTHQILRGHTMISARAYFLWLNNVSHVAARITMCHAGTKSARPSIAPLSEPQWGLPLTEPPRHYSLNYNTSRSDGRKLSTPSTSRTPAARCGEQSTNLLAGLDAPPACAPSRQIPSPRNW